MKSYIKHKKVKCKIKTTQCTRHLTASNNGRDIKPNLTLNDCVILVLFLFGTSQEIGLEDTHTHTTVLWLCGICPGKPG